MIRKLLQILLLILTLTLTLSLSSVFAAISTVDSSGGAYSSVKLQNANNGNPNDDYPAVAYFDHATGELRYSYWITNGTTVNQWIRSVVEEKGVTGYVSLWLDSSNKPYISYYHNISKNNSTGTEISDKYGNHMVGALKYAYCSAIPCLTPESWTKVTVAQIGQSENGYTGGFSSLAFDSTGTKPHIAYYDFSHKIDANDTKKGALKLAYCNINCGVDGSWINGNWVNSNWTISTVDTDGGRSASMVIDSSDKVMLSYDANEVQKIRYAESSSPFSSWTKADIDTAVNTGNLFRDTSIAIDPTTGKPRLVYQYQNQYDYGHSTTLGDAQYDQAGYVLYRDVYYAYCQDAAPNCTTATNWTKQAIATGIPYLRGYTSSIKVGSDRKPRIAYHYWGYRTGNATRANSTTPTTLVSLRLAQDLYYVLCGDDTCDNNPVNTIFTIETGNDAGTYKENTGLYSSMILDSGGNPFISYYNYDSNQLKLYHPANSYNDSGITANVIVSDTSNSGTGLQSGDSFTILFSGATNGSACSITTANIDSILKLSNGHSWKCNGSSVDVQWSTTYNTNDTLKITVHSGTGGCMPTVAIGDRVSLEGACILDSNNNPIILQTEIKGSSDVKPPNGAIAYYKMDEGSKYTAYDSAGGNNASLNKGVAWTTGISGSGVSLDGSDDHLFAPGVPDIGRGKLTIEAWLKPNAFGTGYTLLSKEGSYMLASNGQCAIATTGTAWAWYGTGSVGRLQRNYSGNKDIWRQVVCTYDGTTQKVYIDGILDGTRSATGSVSSSMYPFVMGRREVTTWPYKRGTYVDIDDYADNSACAGAQWIPGDSNCYGENYWGANYYNGKMDEVVIYNVALTLSQIEDRFKQMPAQLERADANDTSTLGYGLQAGDTIAIRFTNETNAPAITGGVTGNINTVLSLNNGHSWLDGNSQITSAVWSSTRFTNDTLTITLSSETSAPTVAIGDIITLGGGVIKEKTGTSSITGSTKIRGSYDLNRAVAYWDFESNANDTVGQYNNGTANGSPTYAAGKFGNAISLASASSQYVSVSNYADLNPSNISVEAWIYPTSFPASGSYREIVGKGVQGTNGYGLALNGNQINIGHHGGGNFSSTTTLTANQWYHVVGVIDGANSKIYINGVEDPATGTVNVVASTDGFAIGAVVTTSPSTYGNYFDGYIDEVVIYNRAITADDVKRRSSAKLKTAVAKDFNSSPGIQSGDKVIITFDAPTAGTSITSANINSALALSSSHTWLDGNGGIGSAAWSTVTYANDTLTITLSNNGTPPSNRVDVGDTITLGTTIADTFNRALTGSIVIGGNFGVNLPANSIAYYNFDEQSGTTAHDSIGNNHGTLGNSFWKTERIFKGLYFDESRYVTVPDSNDFNLSSYTIDAWVKVPKDLAGGAGVIRRIISQQDGLGNNWQMRLEDNKLVLCDSRLTPACSGTSASINDGEWHHLAVVRDGTNNEVLLYIDGVADTPVSTTGGGTAHDITASIQIGQKYDGTNYFYGMIDEIVVYNRALSSAEVQSRYRAPIKSAFTSDIYFNSGIQSGDKVIIRFHGKTNGYAINSGNIGVNLALSSSHTWGTITSAVWSSYKYTNDTLTITLGDRTGATLAGGDTITISGTSGIKDAFGNNISDTMTLSKDFDFNLPEGAVSYYKLENNNDSFGTNNIASNTGVSGGCKFANCYTYGASQYASVTNSYTLNPERITVEAWVNPGASVTTWAAGNAYFFYGANSVRFYGIAGSATIRFSVYVNGAWTNMDYTPVSISGWHHYAATYDGANLRLYMDGVTVGTPVALPGVINQFDTGVFYIAQPATANNPSISIDDMAVYNRALTAEEVLGRYGDYTVTARAYDTSGGGPDIQLNDTVTFKFSGPTNGAVLDASSCPSGSACIDNALFLSSLHTWLDCNNQIVSANWTNTGGFSNDTLTVTLKGPCGTPLKPDVAPLDTVSIGPPIGAAYRAFAKSAKIGGLFGDNLPASGNKVAYWTFDEQSGTTAYDSIGNNHGTLGSSFWKTEGKFKGLYFDGSRYVTVADSNDFNLSSYTIDAWVKVPQGMTTTYGTRRIISHDNETGSYWSMQLTTNNGLQLCDSRLNDPCGNYTATNIDDGEWHHIAVVHDDAADDVILYIDGNAIVTNNNAAGGGSPFAILDKNIQIGSKYNGTEYFYGFIDEIAVFNKALSEAEIRTRYRAPIKAAFTSDPYFESGIQAGKDKVIIRFHGKTNFATTINSANIDTYLPITGKPGGWGAIQGNAVWSTYPNGGTMTNNTLTLTLGTGATIAKGDTITVSGITDMYGNAISDSITLGGDFNLNLPEGAVSYYRFDETSGTTASDSFNGNSGTFVNTPVWTTGKINNAIQFAPDTYTLHTLGAATASSTHTNYNVNGPKDGQGSAVGTCPPASSCSTWVEITASTLAWWQVDLGSIKTVDRVKVYATTTAANVYYKVQTSTDGSTWTDRGSTTTEGWVTFDFTTTARYVRIQETQNAGNNYIYLSEVEVYYLAPNSYVQINNSYSLNPERITVEAWAKSGAANWNVTDAIVNKASAYKLSSTSGSKNVSFSIYAGGAWRTVTFNADADGSFDITQWHHYVGTYDGTTVRIYVDGVERGTGTSYSGTINTYATGNIFIGNDGGTAYLTSIIDEVAVYNRALTLGEILGRYGEYSPITAFAKGNPPTDTGIDAGDTVEIRFPGPTNGLPIDANNIDAVLALSGLHTWKDGSNQITSAVWSTRVYENDTLTITLSATTSAPTVAPLDTISMGGAGEIGTKYRAVASWSAKISGTFGEALPGTPVAFWKMDENLGATAFDSVGSNDGTLSGTALPAWSAGMFNYGLNFNSGTSYLSVPSIDLSGDWSIEGWFKSPLPAVTGNYNSLFGDRRVTVRRLDWHLGTYGASFVDLDTPYVMSSLTSGWHHIAAVGDSTLYGGAGGTKFYIDGVLVGTANYKTAAALTTVGNTTAGNEQFGLIDELAIYSSALTADNVASRYLVFFKEIYAKDTSNGGAGIQNGDQVIVRFDGSTGATVINSGNIDSALQLPSGHIWGSITSAVWSTAYKANDTLTITLDAATATVAMRDTVTLGGVIKDAYGKDITGSMVIGGDFGTNLPDGAVAYYKFDDGTSGSAPATASDSFNDYNGTLTNTPVWTTAGRFNNALQFTGGTGADADYVVVNNDASLNPGRITVEAWVKSGVAAWNVTDALVTKSTAYKLSTTSGSKNVSFSVYVGGAWRTVTFTAGGSFDITRWHHYAGTYDGTTVRIYVDGVEQGTGTSYSGTINTSATGNIFIGNDGGTAYLNAVIDEVVFYNRTLTPTEIRTRYGAGINSVVADDNSGKGPNIQINDRVVITFGGETNGPTINAGNIDTILPLSSSHSWKDGNNAIGSAVWDTTGAYANDRLTITLSGSVNYVNPDPLKPSVVVGDTITLNGTITDSSGRVIRDNIAISGSFGVTAATISSASADDNSGKGPNIQSGDRVTIIFSGATNAPTINAGNIDAILPLSSSHSWKDGNNAIVSAGWSQTTNPNDTLTITLSGPATYADSTPAKPTVVVGDTITVDGTITDPSGKAIVTTAVIGGGFGVASTITPSTALADDNSGKGPNIQSGDRVTITFSGATNGPTINAGNIDTILPVSGKTWLDGNGAIVSASWNTPTNTVLTITLSGPATYADSTPAKPTVAVGDTITIDGTITDSTGKAIISTVAITGSFGSASTIIPSTAVADDNSGKGPNIQSGDRVTITFSGATNATAIDATNINTILPLTGSDFSYDFTGTTISNLTYGGTTGGWISQNNYLSIRNNNNAYDTYVYKNSTFARTAGRAFQAKFNTASGADAMIGWWGSSITVDTNMYADMLYGIRFSNGTFYIIEDNNNRATPGTYSVGTWYDIRIELKATGAKYYYKPTASQTWTLLYDSNYSSESNLRPGILHYTYNIYSYTDDWVVDYSRSWLDGNNTIVSAGWSQTTNPNDTLTITLSGPLNYGDTTPASPTVGVGNTIKIDGGIADSSGKAIIGNVSIGGAFGTASSVVPNTAVASDASAWGPNIQANDRVTITFSGATNQPSINAGNIDTILPLNNGHSWLDGGSAIVSANWDTATQLTVTLSGPATQQDTIPTQPTVVVGDTIVINGTITDTGGGLIIANQAITGTFGSASGTIISTAVAADENGKYGINPGDKVVIKFNGQLGFAGDACPTINASNIDTVLVLNNGHSWRDGSGAIGGIGWDSTTYQCGTLTVTLSANTSAPTVAVGDTITLGGGVIKDKYRINISSNKVILGDFAVPSSSKAWWKLDEASGTAVSDAFGTYSGTLTNSGGSATTWTGGRFSNGLYLDGTTATGDYVTLTTAYPLTADWTIEAWFKWPLSNPITSQQKHTLISSLSTQNDDQIIIEEQTKFLGTSDGNTYYYIPNYNLKNLANGWHHIAAVGSGGSGTAGTTTFYIDGISAGSVGYKSTESIKYIGNSYMTASYNRPIGNTIDNIVIYDTALNAATIKNRYGAWPRSAYAYGTVGVDAGIDTGDQVVIIFDQSTEGNTIDNTNIATALVLSGGHTWGTIQSAVWSNAGGNTNDTLTITLTTTGPPTVDIGDTITLSNNVIKDHAGRPISDTITLQGSFDFKLPLGAIAYWRFDDGTVSVKDSFGSNHGVMSTGTLIDNFSTDTSGSWTTNTITASVSNGYYNAQITTVTDPFFWKSTSFSGAKNTLEFIYKGYGATGPSTLTVYYTDGVSCTVFSGTCVQSFSLVKDTSWHTLTVTMTDAEWNSGDTIGNIRFDFDGATGLGTMKVDSISFSSSNFSADAMYGTKGVTIDAADEAVALTNSITMPTEWTIIGWLKTPVYGAMDNALIHSSSDHEHAICIHTGTGNAEVGNVSPTTDPGGSLERGTGYFLNTSLKGGWHQIAAVGTGGDGTAGTTTYYVDGQPVGTPINYKAYTAIGSLGNNTGAGAHAIGTTIDEISVYNRPLSATEIRQYYGARLKYARANDASGGDSGIDAGDQVVIRFDGETNAPTIDATNIDTVLVLSNGHSWKDNGGTGGIGSAAWSTTTYTNDTLTITLSTNLIPPTVTNRDTITLDGVTIKDLNRVITGSIDISGDFDGAIAYYDLDEGAAVTAADSINGNNGTLGGQSSTLPTWVSGYYQGTALEFNDANGQYVTIPDNDSFNLTSYTIEAWIKLPTTIPSNNYMRILSQESNTNPTNYWSLAINPSGQLVMCDSLSALTEIPYATYSMGGLPTGQNPRCEAVTTKTLNDNKWHFVSVVRDTGSGNFKFYIDHGNCSSLPCVPDKTVAGGAGSGAHNIAGTVEIGRKNGFTGNPTSLEYFRGVIDHVAIYNYAMTDAEVNLHHFLYPSEAWAANTSDSVSAGIQAGDTVTIVFNGETGATAINSGNINNTLKLSNGHSWLDGSGNLGTPAPAWSQTYYPNDTLKITLSAGTSAPTVAVGDIITLGSVSPNVVLDIHNNVISGTIAITGSFDVNVPIGAIAYWDFNEGINSSIADKVGAYSGTIYNPAGDTDHAWVAGKFSYALEFPVNNKGYVSLPTVVPLSSDNWTIEAWFYAPLPTNSNSDNILINGSGAGTEQILSADGVLGTYSTADGGGLRTSGFSMSSLSTGWHHLAAVGKKQDNKTYFYIDGTLRGTANYQSQTSIARIGNGRYLSPEFQGPFGKVDDVVVYGRALSTAEISQRAAR